MWIPARNYRTATWGTRTDGEIRVVKDQTPLRERIKMRRLDRAIPVATQVVIGNVVRDKEHKVRPLRSGDRHRAEKSHSNQHNSLHQGTSHISVLLSCVIASKGIDCQKGIAEEVVIREQTLHLTGYGPVATLTVLPPQETARLFVANDRLVLRIDSQGTSNTHGDIGQVCQGN